jgi:hypothetical protein
MAPAEPEEGFKVTDRRHRAEEESARPAEPAARSATAEPATSERNLIGLFMMLGSSALMALGETGDPAAAEQERDLPVAADVIDVLLLLREKTEGHRDPDETRVLEELLYDLQMRYVRVTQRPG